MQSDCKEKMTLDEGIEHCICLSYKSEYKQFAKWLKELKEYRAAFSNIVRIYLRQIGDIINEK